MEECEGIPAGYCDGGFHMSHRYVYRSSGTGHRACSAESGGITRIPIPSCSAQLNPPLLRVMSIRRNHSQVIIPIKGAVLKLSGEIGQTSIERPNKEPNMLKLS